MVDERPDPVSSDDVLDAPPPTIEEVRDAMEVMSAVMTGGWKLVRDPAGALNHGDTLTPAGDETQQLWDFTGADYERFLPTFALRRSVCSDTPAVPGVRSTKIQHYVDTMREPSAADTPEQETNQ